jgi:hypothetical protein
VDPGEQMQNCDPEAHACEVVFIFKDTEPSPLQVSSSVRQKGGLPAAQAAYIEALCPGRHLRATQSHISRPLRRACRGCAQ